MKTSIENVSTLGRRLNIEVPAEVVSGAFDRMFKSIQKDAQIKGFRQGKAPMATIRSIYGDRVQEDIARNLVQEHFYKAMAEHALNPVSEPEFDFDLQNIKEGNEFKFAVDFEVRPEITLKKIEGLEVEKEKFNVDESRVDEVVNNIRSGHADWVPVLDNRAAQLQDQAVLDFVGRVNGELLENGSGTDFPLELGSDRFIPGFEEGVVGMNVGQTKTISLKFPDTYHATEIAGKPVDFEVTLKSLKKKVLPELNEEFLKTKLGGMESIEKLRESIRKDISESEAKRIEGDLKNNLLRALVRANPVEVPASLLKEQKAALVEDMKKRLSQQGLSPEDFAKYTEKWDGDFDTTAREMIQSGFLVDAIATQNNLSWSEEDLEAKYSEYSKQTGIEIDKIRDFYSRPEQTQRLTYMITEEKVIAFLLSKSKVKEVEKPKTDKE